MRIALFLAGALAAQGASVSQPSPVTLRFGGPAVLAVGDLQTDVLAMLRTTLLVAPVQSLAAASPAITLATKVAAACPDRSTWVVYEKQEPRLFVGGVTFCAGRVESASREWLLTDSAETPGDVVSAIHALYTHLRADQAACSVDSKFDIAPGLEMKSAILRCGRRSATISLTTSVGKQPTVSVKEEIR